MSIQFRVGPLQTERRKVAYVQAKKAYGGNRGMAPLIRNFSTRLGRGVSGRRTPPPTTAFNPLTRLAVRYRTANRVKGLKAVVGGGVLLPLTPRPNRVLKLRISGAIPLFPPYAFLACT